MIKDRILKTLPPPIYSLSNIKTLQVSNNKHFVFVDGNVKQLTSLTALFLHNNQLSFISNEIGFLTNLTLLDLSHNKLQKLPDKLAFCCKLSKLDASHNALRKIPKTVSMMTNLRELILDNNKITLEGIPSHIVTMTKLSKLSLKNNPVHKVLNLSEEMNKELGPSSSTSSRPEEIIKLLRKHVKESYSKKIKVYLVGNPGTGKSSLSYSLFKTSKQTSNKAENTENNQKPNKPNNNNNSTHSPLQQQPLNLNSERLTSDPLTFRTNPLSSRTKSSIYGSAIFHSGIHDSTIGGVDGKGGDRFSSNNNNSKNNNHKSGFFNQFGNSNSKVEEEEEEEKEVGTFEKKEAIAEMEKVKQQEETSPLGSGGVGVSRREYTQFSEADDNPISFIVWDYTPSLKIVCPNFSTLFFNSSFSTLLF